MSFPPEIEEWLIAFAQKEIAIERNNALLEAAKATEKSREEKRNAFYETLVETKEVEIEAAMSNWDLNNS
jgi:hypothetical protein